MMGEDQGEREIKTLEFINLNLQNILCLEYVCKLASTWKSRKENPQKQTQLSPRSHPRHLVGKRTAQKDPIKDITSDSQVNSYFP